MNVDDIISGKTTPESLNPLPSVGDMLAPFMWLSALLTIAFIVLYVYTMLRRRKVENAIIAIQKTLSEMNERDKQRTNPPAAAPSAPAPRLQSETIIADASSTSSDA